MNRAALQERPLDWRAVCELAAAGRFDGFSVDLDQWGRILMTPVTFTHGAQAARIASRLGETLPHGTTVVEVGVATRLGTKAPDVMWASAERVARRTSDYDDELAGEICVEVLSPSNHPAEIEEKRRLYFEQGAVEVWTCDTEGTMRFWHGPDDERDGSALARDFPVTV